MADSPEENKLDRILDVLTEHGESLAQVDVRLEHYNQQLEYHIKRSAMLEERLGPIESFIKSLTRLTKAAWALLMAVATAWLTAHFTK